MPIPTRTGAFRIGLRQGRSDWQKNLPELCRWANSSGFVAIDIDRLTATGTKTIDESGLALGTVDLLEMGDITHPDASKRKQIINANIAYVKEAAALGAKVFFTVVGGDPAKKRAENYRIAVESFTPIANVAASVGAVIACEGYPGRAPDFAMLCTTPETVRAFLKDIPRGIAINYDPSHLIRLGVDHIRFLKEFLPHVVHVHGKDTALFPEAHYEYGIYQPSAFQPSRRFGEQTWRYTIPGHGVARWAEIFQTLEAAQYPGIISIELEDETFNGTEAGEKAGLSDALAFLQSA